MSLLSAERARKRNSDVTRAHPCFHDSIRIGVLFTDRIVAAAWRLQASAHGERLALPVAENSATL